MWWTAWAWGAEPVLVGTVGDLPVELVLPVGTEPGHLRYVRAGATLSLEGPCGDPCALTESDASGRATGRLEARWSGEVLEGTWSTPDGSRRLPLHAERGPDAAIVWTRAARWARPAHPVKTDPVVVELPAVLVPDPGLQTRLDAILTVERLVGDPQERLLADGWVDEVHHEVALDRAGVLAIRVHVSGSAAYPDGFSRSVTLDLRTGSEIGAATFGPEGRLAIGARVAAEAASRRAAADPEVRDLLAADPFPAAAPASYWPAPDGLHATLAWGVPHALAALAPDDDVCLPWATVAAAIPPGSPLARLLGP